MTDNEIIQALECFKSEDCLGEQCPYFEKEGLCGKPMCSDVYDFIYRQKAEIERLQKENKEHKAILEAINDEFNPLPFETDFDKAIKTAKSEAYREFAERFKRYVTTAERTPSTILNYSAFGIVNMIDLVYNELTRNSHGKQ